MTSVTFELYIKFMPSDSTQRFSDRVNDYVKFRPGYPAEVLQVLITDFGLKTDHIVADVGSGTGISAEIFLRNGNTVFAIEPNTPMRLAAEKNLSQYPNFHSINGTAEQTGLSAGLADLIVAAQAFHWFDPETTKAEFRRILKENGCVAILFNDRKTTGSSFAVQYENLLNEFGTDYKEVKHRNIDEKKIGGFLGNFSSYRFPNTQVFDFNALLGRLKSSSYCPNEGQPRYIEMLEKLKDIFKLNQQNGLVSMEYTTQLFCSLH